MNFEDLAFGWREAVVGIIALLALYVVVVVIRLRRLRPPSEPVVDAPAARETVTEEVAAEPPPEIPAVPEFPWNEPPEVPPVQGISREAALLVRLQVAEGELAQLRDEVVAMRGELDALRDDVGKQLERMQASHHVAPIYGDAMQMAAAGYDAATIAERCGVARAEAELVVALIRNRDDDAETMRER